MSTMTVSFTEKLTEANLHKLHYFAVEFKNCEIKMLRKIVFAGNREIKLYQKI